MKSNKIKQPKSKCSQTLGEKLNVFSPFPFVLVGDFLSVFKMEMANMSIFSHFQSLTGI